ncbi:MAG: SH3 domain-containing protein [Pseudobutyrivibrio sp.]|nr:SH3 domain-containing protein [Pseudobutyrivibrio sp.]
MSKNKNYGSFYSRKEPEETVEVSYENKTEEVVTAEEAPETPVEEEKKEEPEVEAPAPKKEEKFAVVANASKVNMRYRPDKGSQAINILPEKAKVKVLEETNDEWWKVHYKGYTGFMMTKYLKRV